MTGNCPRCIRVALLSAACCAPTWAGTVPKRLLGPEVNTTTHREILPVVSPDGQTLWFIREGLDSAIGERAMGEASAAIQALEAQLPQMPAAERAQIEAMLVDLKKSTVASPPVGLQKQTVWVSERQPDGAWATAVRAPAPLNDDVSPSGVVTALPDGNTLLAGKFDVAAVFTDMMATAAESANSVSDADLLAMLAPGSPTAKRASLPSPDPSRDDHNRVIGLSRRTADGWSELELLRVIGYAHVANVRSDYYLAPNGQVLVLSLVNSESVAGSRDLFVSHLAADGRWTKPITLTALNSAKDEISPWIAPDNKAIYFSSNRPGGLGEQDIWMARRLDDSWLQWSAPENLGAEINTKEADMNLAVDATGRYAFMSLGPRGQEDLWEFELPARLRPTPVAFVRGRVTDPAGGAIAAAILYEVLRTADSAGQAGSDPHDGRYQIALPIGEDYGFRASASGYLAVADRIDLSEAKDQQVFERDLVLIPIAAGVPIRLNNIFFDTAETRLLPKSRAELERLAALLRSAPSMRIEIRGHTDAVDDPAFNQQLSEGRAAAVVDYLVTAGIAADRLESRGFGESQPIAGNDSEKGRKLNRRVEFVILQH